MHRTLSVIGLIALASPLQADPLPSWNDTATKDAIIAFVEAVSDPASDDYVPPAERIAVFDNDGTLWAEQPMYFQFFYALYALQERAKADPSVLATDTLRAAAAGDLKTVAAGGTDALKEIVAASHADITVEAFQKDVAAWAATARHPGKDMLLADMTYQPMTELLRYLRDEEFETWIVTGGGLHFVRALSPDAYNIPPEQVVGSIAETSYQVIDGKGQMMKLPDIAFLDDKGGKPVGIDRNIGTRPILAFGNSDGDYEMLEYVTTGDGPRLGLLLRHTDAEREWAYDRESHIGKLARGLDDADRQGWIIVDMAQDWTVVWGGAEGP